MDSDEEEDRNFARQGGEALDLEGDFDSEEEVDEDEEDEEEEDEEAEDEEAEDEEAEIGPECPNPIDGGYYEQSTR